MSIQPETYVAVLCSRIPNNHCEMCSYFSPDYHKELGYRKYDGINSANEPPVIGTTRAENCGGYVKCPSCGRSCQKVFVIQGEELPIRVPDNWNTRPCHNTIELMEKIVPQFPRPTWHEGYWREIDYPWYEMGTSQEREKKNNYRGKRAVLLGGKIQHKEVEIDFDNLEAKPSKFKVKLAN